MGRPTLLTPEVQARIVEALRKGNYRSTAAAAAGIHRNTLVNWEKWADEGKAPYVDFLTAMQQAEAEAEMEGLARIRDAKAGTPGVSGADPWQKDAWFMERRYASRWCARVKQQVQENVEALTSKLKADPELHRKVVDVLATDEEASGGSAAGPARH